MKPITSFALKALRIGPVPYLGLGIAIIGLGAVLQLRGDTMTFADGRTVFGTFAQIGGCIGLLGLVTMIVRGLPAEPYPGAAEDGVPQSVRTARMDGADPRPGRPARPAAPASPAAKASVRVARQLGLQAIRHLARR